MQDTEMKNWVPYKLTTVDGQLLCNWLNTFDNLFTEPFFGETITKCKSTDFRIFAFSSVSDLAMMKKWSLHLDATGPTAFIFHISRCGSTLVSQLLATSDEHIVLSEVPFFDDLLRLPYKNPDFDKIAVNELLEAAIKHYGQKRTGKEKRLFIKADSWHLFFYRQLRQLYPIVPFVFIYRSPDEVFRSHTKLRGMQAVPGLIEPELFGFENENVGSEGMDIYLSKVLESYFNECLEIVEKDERFLLLNYIEGPMQMIEKIAAFVKMELSGQDLSKMKERSLYHSKKPGETFREDPVSHIPSSLEKAMELYRLLEEKRMAISFI
jgi:hypothetical protein